MRFLLLWLIVSLLSRPSKGFAIPKAWFAQPSLRPNDPDPPVWPNEFTVSYQYTLPYTSEVQRMPVSYDVTFMKRMKEGKVPKLRIESLNGSNVLIMNHKKQYESVPRLEEQTCLESKTDAEDLQLTVLPNVSGWTFLGSLDFRGHDANLWEYRAQFEEKRVDHKFYASTDNVPLRLHVLGTEMFTGAHFDEWVIDYTKYDPTRPDKSKFEKLDICSKHTPTMEYSRERSHMKRWKSRLPVILYRGHEAYDKFLATYNPDRRHSSLSDYEARVNTFLENRRKIDRHNAIADKTYTMALNKFGDWSREEFLAVMLPRHGRQSERNKEFKDPYEIPHETVVDPGTIPASVDWRGTTAAGIVKDQANCGSCWAFGAVGAMEAAWNLKTGESIQLSEQQVMDCSWGYVPGNEGAASACDGGDAYAGVGHIISVGGIAAADSYRYLGIGDYCKEKQKEKVAAFKSYSKVPRFNDSLLMEALYSRGPVAVSLDASQDSFTFYSSGVYYDAKCMFLPNDLDHSMMLVGYGTDEEGGDYWLIKNSWSKHWGDEGYVKISRVNHGCGASTDALYVIPAEKYTPEDDSN